MTQPPNPPPGNPPPYGAPQPPYGQHQPPYAGPPRRQRPRVVWFVVGAVLIVLAPVIFVGSLFTVLRPLMQEDAVFAVSDSPVQVDLPAGEERALFSTNGFSAACSAVDGTGREVEFRGVTGEFSYNEWTAVSRFDTGDGNLTFDCVDTTGGGEEIRIAQLPSAGTFVAGIVIGIVAPLVLGLIGLLMLIVTAVLYATGAPRQKKA